MEQIDLVYTWVDDSDPKWQQSKADMMVRYGRNINAQAVARGRFVNNDELRYSLRSVEKNMGWVRNIYVVTADQTPKWLNTDHPKIRLVSHRDIMPADALPTFNSTAIEMAICNIEGLSEKFILSNDDLFVIRKVGPEFFYNERGVPIARFATQRLKGESLYQSQVLGMARLVAKRYGKMYRLLPHHNMDAYLRSDIVECISHFEELVGATLRNHFRMPNEAQRSLWYYWALVNGRAERKMVRRYNRKESSLGERVRCALHGRYCMDSKSLSIQAGRLHQRLKKYNPILLCLNDTELATDEDRVALRNFMEYLFPEKSCFEK